MNRRRFLSTTLAATGLGLAAPWPAFLGRAFGDGAAPPIDGPRARTAELGEAIARAKRDARPLLVIVVPADPHRAHERGTRVGELINHGGSGVAFDLLICEIACATLEETRRALPVDVAVKPAAPDGVAAQGPAMLVIELDAQGAERLPTATIDLPPESAHNAFECEPEPSIRARIAQGAAALHTAVLPRPDSLARRAEANRAALDAADCAALDEALAGTRPLDAALARRAAPALVLIAAAGDAGSQARARAALDAAAQTLVKARPAGAQWARDSGCGVNVESDTPPLLRPCGMGQVPALSARFLHFYATVEAR